MRYSLLRTTRHLAAGLALSVSAVASAAYPDRPITLVVAFAPGGNVDATARVIGPALSRQLGQPVVIDNRAGAGGTIGSTLVANAAPDGYTLMVGSTATNATAPAFIKSTRYDPVKDFIALGGISITPSVIVVAPSVKAGNYADLVAASRAASGGLNMGSPGTGSLNHLTTELLKQKTGLQALHVPYKGAGPALTDLMGNQIEAMVDQLSSSAPLIASGRLRAIAQTGAARSPILSDVPTLREQGVEGVDVAVYTGLFAPAGLSPETQEILVKALQAVMADQEVQQRLQGQGSEPMQVDQPAFAKFVADEAARWLDVVQTAGIAAD